MALLYDVGLNDVQIAEGEVESPLGSLTTLACIVRQGLFAGPLRDALTCPSLTDDAGGVSDEGLVGDDVVCPQLTTSTVPTTTTKNRLMVLFKGGAGNWRRAR